MAEVRRLKEENCMAPDFVYESVETEFLVIAAPERIFPVTVNLYTREEYDALLSKQVEKRCPGCLRYTDDGSEELTGHHREISLAGVCYSREEKGDFFPFGCCVQALWSRLAKEVNDLAAMIETGDQKGLEKRVNREIEKFFSASGGLRGRVGRKILPLSGLQRLSSAGAARRPEDVCRYGQ